jgi:hypothetical protein
MSTTEHMLNTHPGDLARVDRALLAACIQACATCAQVCTSCADACLADETVAHLRGCIRTDLDCADWCEATARILARQTETDLGLLRAALEACATACRICGEECGQHADMHEHCRISAEACRACEEACNQLLNSLS